MHTRIQKKGLEEGRGLFHIHKDGLRHHNACDGISYYPGEGFSFRKLCLLAYFQENGIAPAICRFEFPPENFPCKK